MVGVVSRGTQTSENPVVLEVFFDRTERVDLVDFILVADFSRSQKPLVTSLTFVSLSLLRCVAHSRGMHRPWDS